MSTSILAPTLTLKSWRNDGTPNAFGTVATYAAGSTTPITTYVDSTATTTNANPITLNSRGEANVWLLPNVAYKFVEYDSSGTILRTTDQVTQQQLISLYGGVDTGVVNAYILAYNAPYATYQDGIAIYWIPANTNTAASTINVSFNNGATFAGVVNIVNQDGSALSAGELTANQIAFIIYKGGKFLLSSLVGGSGIINVAGVNVTGSGIPPNGEYLPAANTWGVATNSVQRATINSTGNVVINAPSAGVAVKVNGVSGTHSTQIADSATNLFNAGFLEIPQNIQNVAYQLVLSDSGKHIYHSDGTARTYTIPANGAVAFPIGTAVTFVNDASAGVNVTIAITTDTLYFAVDGTTGSRILARYGIATVLKVSATRWTISGTGLS